MEDNYEISRYISKVKDMGRNIIRQEAWHLEIYYEKSKNEL